MAFCDYHPCDCCGERKTFYDADMDYGHSPDGTLLYGGYEHEGVYIGYRAYALCHECEKTHQIVIEPRATLNPEQSDAS